jgi:hypothetical protein
VIYTKNGQSLARISVANWVDTTLPDVEVIQRDISGLLVGAGTTITRVEGVVTGDGIDSSAPVTAEFYYNPLTGNYSGFVYFPPVTSVQYYQVQVKIYGPGNLLVGSSQVVPFTSFAGNVTVPAFQPGNARPVAKAGIDTAVVPGGTIRLHGSAVDSNGTIATWEWSIGGSAFVAGSPDTTFTRATQGAYPCILRVTDNSGNQALDTVIVAVLAQGVAWTSRTSGTTSGLNSVVWTGTQFVAVGSGGTALTSPDGITWTTRSVGGTVSLNSLAWSGQKLVAAPTGGASGPKTVYTSTDGITWASSTITVPVGLSPGMLVVSSADTTLFAAVLDNTNRHILRSVDDGLTWAVDTVPPEGGIYISSIWAFTRHAGRFVGVGGNGVAASSVNGGGNWTRHTTSETWPRPYGGVYDYTMQSVVSTGTHAVAVGYAGHVMRSTDGVTWQQPRVAGNIPDQTAGGSAGDLYDVVWTGNGLIAVGNGTTVVSADGGANWAQVPGGSGNFRSVAWNGTRVVAVGNGGTILTSP